MPVLETFFVHPFVSYTNAYIYIYALVYTVCVYDHDDNDVYDDLVIKKSGIMYLSVTKRYKLVDG